MNRTQPLKAETDKNPLLYCAYDPMGGLALISADTFFGVGIFVEFLKKCQSLILGQEYELMWPNHRDVKKFHESYYINGHDHLIFNNLIAKCHASYPERTLSVENFLAKDWKRVGVSKAEAKTILDLLDKECILNCREDGLHPGTYCFTVLERFTIFQNDPRENHIKDIICQILVDLCHQDFHISYSDQSLILSGSTRGFQALYNELSPIGIDPVSDTVTIWSTENFTTDGSSIVNLWHAYHPNYSLPSPIGLKIYTYDYEP